MFSDGKNKSAPFRVNTQLFAHHERTFENFRFVYPVLSRRANGLSLGVNLNPDKVCNFDCIYCQVNRTLPAETTFVETERLLDELNVGLRLILTGDIYRTEKFRCTPPSLRRLNDIAFSGDGEPTTYRNFDELIAKCAEVKSRHRLGEVKMVLITNASMFHREHVQRGLAILNENNGEIWAKLDAGTEDYYKLVDRTTIPFQQILDNIRTAAQVRPIVIQALFMNVNGDPPSFAEQLAFCDRLSEFIAAGGIIKLVQIYTMARRPTEPFVTPLSDAEVDSLTELVRFRTGLKACAYYAA
ncbi:MAG TPA: radical SAM protein [Pirellulales bacterium]|jgi:wyosine [tRNA(Phe)-imidazoG37] synthetase (radical SAM superfamily)|nr:radical SAM protein [Pirellulales bacterium]